MTKQPLNLKYYISTSHDPFFNLALEEYLIKNSLESIFLIYVNQKCVIIGKNQNPFTEANLDFMKKNDIMLVRRLSGGGAVYQDLGNVNYSFILKNQASDLYNFKKYCQYLINVLNHYPQVKVEFKGRNDLVIDNRKISGTAQFVHGNDLVHHGTILHSADFSHISQILLPNNNKLKTKGVKSIISRVSNLANYLPSYVSPQVLQNDLVKTISNGQKFTLSPKQLTIINEMAQNNKQALDFLMKNQDFNYTHFTSEYIPSCGAINLYFSVDENNKITSFKVFGEYFSTNDSSDFAQKMIGVSFNKKAISKLLESIPNFSSYFHNLTQAKFIELVLQSKPKN